MFATLFRRLRRRPPAQAADLNVRATLRSGDGRLRVLIHSGQRTLLDEDGRPLTTEALGRSELEVPLTELQRREIADHPLGPALGSLNGKTVRGRLYLLGDQVEYLEMGAHDGSQLTWSARPGWCEPGE